MAKTKEECYQFIARSIVLVLETERFQTGRNCAAELANLRNAVENMSIDETSSSSSSGSTATGPQPRQTRGVQQVPLLQMVSIEDQADQQPNEQGGPSQGGNNGNSPLNGCSK